VQHAGCHRQAGKVTFFLCRTSRNRTIAPFYLSTALDGVNGQANMKANLSLRKYPVPIITEAVWALDAAWMLWTRGKSIFPGGNRALFTQRVTHSLYRLSFPDPCWNTPKGE